MCAAVVAWSTGKTLRGAGAVAVLQSVYNMKQSVQPCVLVLYTIYVHMLCVYKGSRLRSFYITGAACSNSHEAFFSIVALPIKAAHQRLVVELLLVELVATGHVGVSVLCYGISFHMSK